MICLNELGDCSKREILEPLTALIAPFAPHIAEELWHEALGKTTTVCDAEFPKVVEEYLVENSFEYPVMINGKLRFKQEYPLDMSQDDIQKDIVTTEGAQKWLEGKQPKKIIVVKGKIINIVM
jgi:leucyl-tRNA synthetase